jgi:hypothetical protein
VGPPRRREHARHRKGEHQDLPAAPGDRLHRAGRIGSPNAARDADQDPQEQRDRRRGEAALALGAVANREAIEALVAALDDPKDGWVRFCAYETLKKMSGQDHPCDWIFGNASSRRSAVAHYREWAGINAK